MEESTSIITNDIQCVHRRRGGNCYASWPGRVHPECREAAREAEIALVAAGTEAGVVAAAVASADRKFDRDKRRAERLAGGGTKLGK